MTSVSETTLGRGFRWLVAHWYIPLIGLAALAAWLVARLVGMPQRAPREVVGDELDAIDQAEAMRRFAIDRGARLANQLIDDEYHATLRNLDTKQRRRADDLRRNPGKRLRFLRRLSKRLEQRAEDNPGA